MIVGDVLADVRAVNQQLPPLMVELLNAVDDEAKARTLRTIGQHLGSLSAECLARASEVDGHMVERVIIDAT